MDTRQWVLYIVRPKLQAKKKEKENNSRQKEEKITHIHVHRTHQKGLHAYHNKNSTKCSQLQLITIFFLYSCGIPSKTKVTCKMKEANITVQDKWGAWLVNPIIRNSSNSSSKNPPRFANPIDDICSETLLFFLCSQAVSHHLLPFHQYNQLIFKFRIPHFFLPHLPTKPSIASYCILFPLSLTFLLQYFILTKSPSLGNLQSHWWMAIMPTNKITKAHKLSYKIV